MPLPARAEDASGQRFEIYILIIHNYIMMLVHKIIQIHVFINEEIVSEVHVQYKLGKGKKRNKVQIFKEDSLI